MSKVKLAIRIRPFTDKELKTEGDREAVVCVSDEHTITITNIKVNTSGAGDSRERIRRYYAEYTFNSVLQNTQQPYATQETVFESIGNGVLASISEGLSACVLAYGQSATGKTYTMMGTDSKPGLIPRLCQALGNGNPCDIKVSFLEIYNEKVHDLLAGDAVSELNSFCSLPRRKGNARKDLRVREHPTRGPYVQNLRRVSVSDARALLSLVAEGARRRRTAATRRNPLSSRSHALLELSTPRATLHLADLAGSEKASWEGCGGGRQKEGANINKSLVALSNVISALVNAGSGRGRFVPYRDSALTWLLKDCFSGGGNIFVIATVSPSFACYNESASTLRWAAQVRRLQCPKIAPTPGIISKAALQAQLNQLLAELGHHHILYIPESGKITYGDEHWMLKPEINNPLSNRTSGKIGNIMNTTPPKAIVQNSESTTSSVASGSSDANNTFGSSSQIASEINKEVDKLFGPALERTRSGSAIEIVAPIRHKKRQYSSQEVLPVVSYKGDIGEGSSDVIRNRNENKLGDKFCTGSSKTAKVPILCDNNRAEIVASVTDRLYSKFKKDATANKMESMMEKKIMQPLSELRICTNARQRLMELSQKAIRNKRRIGIPAHTQTRRTVIRVKDQGINVQTDLEAFIMRKNDTEILYRDVATETIPMTPRCKDIAVGEGFLNFHDKSTTMELKKVDTESASVMTDVTTKNHIHTQTQVVPPPRRKKCCSIPNKRHHQKREREDKCLTPSVININISPFYSLDSDTLSSSESSENGHFENGSVNLGTTPDLLANHNGSDSPNTQTRAGKDCRIPKSGMENIITNTDSNYKTDEDFPTEDVCFLPRVTVDSTNRVDGEDIKNMILGRNKNAYPYNIKLSPLKNAEDSKKTIKFKDDFNSKCNRNELGQSPDSDDDNCERINSKDKDRIRKLHSANRHYFLDDYSNSSDSSNFGSDSFVYSKGSMSEFQTTYTSRGSESVHKNKLTCTNCLTTKCNHYFCAKKDIGCDINTNSSSEPHSKSGLLLRSHGKKKCVNKKKRTDNFGCDSLEHIENKILESCDGLEKATNKYESYLERYWAENKQSKIRSPTEYLQYLVQLRREAVKESLSTCSADTMSSS